MKKQFFTLVMLVVGMTLSYAQNQALIDFHPVGDYDLEVRNLMPMRDGSVLVNSQLFNKTVDYTEMAATDVGNVFFKISTNAEIMDTLFIEDPDMNHFLLVPNPIGEDYVYARAVRNLDEGHTDLCIKFFDNQLKFNDEKELWVPLSDKLYKPLGDCYCLDEAGDMIIALSFNNEEVGLFRVALDGTVKASSIVTGLPFNITNGRHLSVYNYGDSQHCLWGFKRNTNSDGTRDFVFAFLDEQLQLIEEKIVSVPQGCGFGYNDDLMIWGGNTIVNANRYALSNGKQGPALVVYDKSSLAPVNSRYFTECPEAYDGPAHIAYPTGVAQATDGNLFFAYFNYFPDAESALANGPAGQACVMKLDANLNILWQRFFLEPVGYYPEVRAITPLSNNGVAVAGYTVNSEGNVGLMFYVVNGSTGNTDVNDDRVRPYAFYPNPVGDCLGIQFSPDVTPTLVELYDAQGRLVMRQKTSLESVNTTGLKAGLYTVKVTLDNGKTYSDTVIKK